jgi:hypothetical protein
MYVLRLCYGIKASKGTVGELCFELLRFWMLPNLDQTVFRQISTFAIEKVNMFFFVLFLFFFFFKTNLPLRSHAGVFGLAFYCY